MSDQNGDAGVERRDTERVILEQRAAILLPRDVDPDRLEQAIKLLEVRRRGKPAVELVWVEASRQVGATKVAAIEAHAGKAGTADAKVGTFRAPSLTAWKGAVVYEAPPEPLVQRSMIE